MREPSASHRHATARTRTAPTARLKRSGLDVTHSRSPGVFPCHLRELRNGCRAPRAHGLRRAGRRAVGTARSPPRPRVPRPACALPSQQPRRGSRSAPGRHARPATAFPSVGTWFGLSPRYAACGRPTSPRGLRGVSGRPGSPGRLCFHVSHRAPRSLFRLGRCQSEALRQRTPAARRREGSALTAHLELNTRHPRASPGPPDNTTEPPRTPSPPAGLQTTPRRLTPLPSSPSLLPFQ